MVGPYLHPKSFAMRRLIMVLSILLSFFSGHSQKKATEPAVKKQPIVTDSMQMSTDRQKLLSSSLNTARSERKNILLLSATAKNTRDQDASYFARLERKNVRKVNSATIVSKYAGETEKNLEKLFNEAASKQLILFFDESDQLFSKSEQPQSISNAIQTLAESKKVMTIFWCEEDCRKWFE